MKLVQGALFVLTAITLMGCASQVSGAVQSYAPGFFGGLIHGVIAPLSFVGSLFIDDIAVYAVPNNGGWYDFGFLIGLALWAGGGAASAT